MKKLPNKPHQKTTSRSQSTRRSTRSTAATAGDDGNRVSGRRPAHPVPTAAGVASTSQEGRRGRKPGDGIGKYKSEAYKHEIQFQVFKDYTFPTGKVPKTKEEKGREADARGHVEEVARYVVEDMYEHLTDNLIVPEDSPVDWLGE